MPKVRVWRGFEFDLIGMDICYMLGFYKRKVHLQQIPAPNAAGVVIEPGDILTNLGGKKTSAGFTHIWFDPGGGLCYQGTHTGLDGKFLCFDQIKNGQILKPQRDEYKRLFYAYQLMDIDPPCWFFTNHARAGRILESTIIKKKN